METIMSLFICHMKKDTRMPAMAAQWVLQVAVPAEQLKAAHQNITRGGRVVGAGYLWKKVEIDSLNIKTK